MVTHEPDVLVVGAGLSGMAVASQLAARGVRCEVLEVGTQPVLDQPFQSMAEFRQAMQPFVAVDEQQWAYSSRGVPFQWNRVRAVGGRSLLWGGWAATPDRRCWSDAQAWGRPWPMPFEAFEPLLQRSAKWMNTVRLPRQERFDGIARDLGLAVEAKLAAKSPFGDRPFHPLDGVRGTCGNLTLTTGAACTRVLLKNGRCTGLEYLDMQDASLRRKSAAAVVLCPSPIETTRILMASRLEDHSDGAQALGQGLTDHIVAAYLVLTEARDTLDTYKTTGHNVAYMPRIERVGKAYRGGFTVELHGPDPLDLLEDKYLAQIGIAAHEAGSYCGYLIYVIGELGPDTGRFVDLDARRLDGLGRPAPRVNCTWTDEDRAIALDMDSTGRDIAESLAREHGGRVFRLLDTLSFGGAGISHEAGTCAMGSDPSHGVVGLDGQVHDVRGLFVADASIMPTALDCPPSLALVGLALNTADGVERALATRALYA